MAPEKIYGNCEHRVPSWVPCVKCISMIGGDRLHVDVGFELNNRSVGYRKRCVLEGTCAKKGGWPCLEWCISVKVKGITGGQTGCGRSRLMKKACLLVCAGKMSFADQRRLLALITLSLG